MASMMGRQVTTWASPTTGLPILNPPFQPFIPNSTYVQPASVDFQNVGTDGAINRDVSTGQSAPLNDVLVGMNVSMRVWATNEHQNYRPGNWLVFHTRNKSASPAAMTVRDFNRMLRISYQQALGLAGSKDPRDAKLSGAINAWLRDGELALTGDPKISDRMARQQNWSVLRCLALETLMDDWNVKGNYQNTDFQNLPRGRETRVALQGPTSFQPCDNLWGRITEGTHVGFVLTRRREVVDGRVYYREFQLKPWSSNSPFPRDPADYCYYDDAEVLHASGIIYIGTVYQHTITAPPNDDEIGVMLGHRGSREEALALKTNQVNLVLDAPGWLRRVYYTP